MKTLTKDARGFVDSVVNYLGKEGKRETVSRVASLLSRVTAQAKKEKSALVESAIALDSEERMRIERLLARLLGHSVDVHYSVNVEIVAGLIIKVADWVLDTSFRGQLAKMQDSMRS